MIEMLKDKKDPVRAEAVTALQMIGPPARSATGALVKLLEDSNLQVRRSAAEALGVINTSSQDWAMGGGPWAPGGMPTSVEQTPGQLTIRGNVLTITGRPVPDEANRTPAPASVPRR